MVLLTEFISLAFCAHMHVACANISVKFDNLSLSMVSTVEVGKVVTNLYTTPDVPWISWPERFDVEKLILK